MQLTRRRSAPLIGIGALVLALGLPNLAGAASTNFVEPPTSPEFVGANPFGVVAIDLDGDTDPDLAVANSSDDSVTILKNNGSGDFAPAATSPETVGDFPLGLVAADLDGDSDPDLAVVNLLSANVTILLNNGSGDFTQASGSPIGVGSSPHTVVAADLDGDADIDLAVANAGSNNVTILRNRGTGKFVEPSSSPVPTGVGPNYLVAADLDGDADVDLAVSNLNGGTITILRNRGTAKFVEPSTSPYGGFSAPNGITAADLDGDGDQDLAVAIQGTDNVALFRNKGNASFTQFSSSPVAAGDFPTWVAAADFDKDGNLDLAVANHDSNNVTILRNKGKALFVQPSSNPESVGVAPVWIAVGDFDGDVDEDLAVANRGSNTVTILLNR